jgi:hypothetical protein
MEVTMPQKSYGPTKKIGKSIVDAVRKAGRVVTKGVERPSLKRTLKSASPEDIARVRAMMKSSAAGAALGAAAPALGAAAKAIKSYKATGADKPGSPAETAARKKAQARHKPPVYG